MYLCVSNHIYMYNRCKYMNTNGEIYSLSNI